MSFARKLFGLAISGALFGGLLALAAPPSTLAADAENCYCIDHGWGESFCGGSGSCFAGVRGCAITCQE